MKENEKEKEKENETKFSIDLIILPEMALTGYVYDNKEEIIKFCEVYNDESETITFKLGKYLSLKYDCYTLIGYPEKKEDQLYNSAALFDRSGCLLKNFRKHFLYETDKVRLKTF